MAIAEVDVKKLHGHGFRRIRRSKVGHNLGYCGILCPELLNVVPHAILVRMGSWYLNGVITLGVVAFIQKIILKLP